MSYPLVYQKSFNDCGPACIFTLCQYYNIPYDHREILALTGLTPAGASIWNMCIALQALGFSCQAVYIQDLYQYDYSFPIIVITKTQKELLHYVLIYKRIGNSLLIGDPFWGMQQMLIDMFLSKFTNMAIIPQFKN